MRSFVFSQSSQPLNLDEKLDQMNEAARWLEENKNDSSRGSGVFILPPVIVPRSRRSYALKRVFDSIASLIALILLSPLLAVLAIIIRMTSKGPAFFKQKRVGEYGKQFVCYKFRTMRNDSDDKVHRDAVAKFMRGEVVDDNAEAGNQVFKLARDPRVTSVGHFLRKTSLDELPQLINVLLGDMSLVGPRPPIPYEVEQYRYRHRYRLLVKPGITGIWQVYGRSSVDFETLVSMDLSYVTDGTFWLDLKLLFLTIGVVVKGSGR